MRIEVAFLRSKVARSEFLLFVVSSLVPVLLLSFLSFGQVQNLLSDQLYDQLKQTNKNFGVALLDRLLLLKHELERFSESAKSSELSADLDAKDRTLLETNASFTRITLLKTIDSSLSRPTQGNLFAEIWQRQKEPLTAGHTILASEYRPDETSRVFLLRLMDPRRQYQDLLVAEIDRSFLFKEIAKIFPKQQLCVLDEFTRPLFCSDPGFEPSPEQLTWINKSTSGMQSSTDKDGTKHLVGYWSIFLDASFFVEKWTLLTRLPSTSVLEPVSDFMNIFVFVIALTLCVVALLSVHQIRKNLIPLETIMEGVDRIANKEFATTIEVKSENEFAELATSINTMAVTIDKQFQTMSTMAKIDRLILSTMTIEDVVRIVLSRMNGVVPHDYISIAVNYGKEQAHCRVYTCTGRDTDDIAISEQQVTSLERQCLLQTPYSVVTIDQGHRPSYLAPLLVTDAQSVLLLPIIIEDDVLGVICLGYRHVFEHSEDNILLACDFSNRVAVALSKASWEEQLFQMAHYDQLTGLPNRMVLMDRLEQAVARAERQECSVALLFLDLDAFKNVNDSLGHIAGDTLLCHVARRIDRVTRSEHTVCRLGGDEFVFVIQQPFNREDSLSQAASIARKVLDALSLPIFVEDREIFTSASVGIACYPTGGKSSLELLKNADAAMYFAKSRGKNNFQFFSSMLNEKAVERLELETDLRHALDRQEFEVYFQPKIDARTNAVCGAEALLRWNHPLRGSVSPDKFIPISEETGLIVPIGEWVIRSVCTKIRGWVDQGISPVRVAINLSSLQFREKGLVERIKTALHEATLEPADLEFEITETAAMRDIKETREILDRLDGMGVSLSIDDFGTGYSSLKYLKHFPLHTLKIDQSFIRNLDRDKKDSAIVRSVITLAHSLAPISHRGVEKGRPLWHNNCAIN